MTNVLDSTAVALSGRNIRVKNSWAVRKCLVGRVTLMSLLAAATMFS